MPLAHAARDFVDQFPQREGQDERADARERVVPVATGGSGASAVLDKLVAQAGIRDVRALSCDARDAAPLLHHARPE